MGAIPMAAILWLLIGSVLFPASIHASGAPPAVWIGAGHIGVSSVALPADGRYVASASAGDATIKIWDRVGANLTRTFAAHLAGVNALDVSADGALLASAADVAGGSGERNVKLWDVTAGEEIRGFDTGEQTAWSVTLSPDGSLIAAGVGYGEIRIWRVSDGVLLRTISGHTWSVFGIAFSPDGTLLASASGDNTAKIWRVSDGAELRTLVGHTFFVDAVAFSPDGTTLATGSWDNTAKIWRVSDGANLQTLTGHTSFVASVAFSADGTRLATGSWDRTIRVWRTPNWSVERTLTVPDLFEVTSVAFGNDSDLLASGGIDGRPRVWSIPGGTLLETYGHHVGTVRGFGYSSDGSLVASACGDFAARIWRTLDGADLVTLTGHDDVVNAVAFLPGDATIATGAGSPAPDTRDPTIKFWRVSDGALLRTLPGHAGGTTAVAKSPDGLFVVSTGRDGNIKFWRISDGVLNRTIAAHAFGISAMTFSADGQLLATAAGQEIKLWQMPAVTLLRTIVAPNAVAAISFSPDRQAIASAEESYTQNVKIWSVADGTLILSLPGHPDGFCGAVSWSSAGDVIASGSAYSRDVRLWRASDGILLARYDRETGWGPNPTLPLAFSPDGRRLAIGRTDATVLLARNPFGPSSDVTNGGPIAATGLRAQPNPMRSAGTVLEFNLTTMALVNVEAFDIGGRKLRVLEDGVLPAGGHSLRWDGRDAAGARVPAGVYFVRLQIGGARQLQATRVVVLD
jgi:WD40 repeat protein